MPHDLVQWRTENAVQRTERPDDPARARRLGWRAKQGYVVARVRLVKGLRMRPKRTGGRKPKASGRYFSTGKAHRQIAEERANRTFPNLEVLSSYPLDRDGTHEWYEVLLVDPHHPVILADKRIRWIAKQPGRAHRGLTGAGKRSRMR